MFFNMDYSAFSNEAPLSQGGGELYGEDVGRGGLWKEFGGKKGAGMRFDKGNPTAGADAAAFKEFARKKLPRERSPNNVQDLYKTELCNSFTETGSCPYGANCQFAHGMQELREVTRHPKYKTKMCRNYAEKGSCPYGSRCRFIHGDEDESMLEMENEPMVGSGNVGMLGNGVNPVNGISGVNNMGNVGPIGGVAGANSLFYRPPSLEPKITPPFQGLNHTIPLPPTSKIVGQQASILGTKPEMTVGGTSSAPASTATSPAPLATGQPLRASTPNPQQSSGDTEGELAVGTASTETSESQKGAESDAPKRRLAVFKQFAN